METLSIKPIWKAKAGRAVVFSPDSRWLGLAGARGPARIVETVSWIERCECEGLKEHISQMAFAPDGSRLAIAQMYDRLTICDPKTGKIVAKGVFGDTRVNHLEEQSGLVYSPQTGKILRSARKPTIDVIDSLDAALVGEFRPSEGAKSVDAISFNQDGSILVAVWSGKSAEFKQVSFWSWKERALLRSFNFKSDCSSDMALSPDGLLIAVRFRRFAMPESRSGLLLLDAATGDEVRVWDGMECCRVAFAPNSSVLIATDGGCLVFGDSKDETPRACIQVLGDSGEVAEIAISPDGKFVAAGTVKGALVWDFLEIRKRLGI
jgi:WD40 repeat protein